MNRTVVRRPMKIERLAGVKRYQLDDALARMRESGPGPFYLAARAMPPWMRKWAEDNNLRAIDEPDAPLGKAFLIREPYLPESELAI